MIIFNSKQHLSFCIYSLVCYCWQGIPDYLFIFASLIGCLLPDIDHKQSIAGHVIPAWLIFKHGKQTHTLLVSSIFLIIYAMSKNSIWLGLFFGYLNHLIADNLQGNNLKYLYYPFKRRKK
jgi:membrane-bound metal-dependent hydrolase YbcI (DUF457 family)